MAGRIFCLVFAWAFALSAGEFSVGASLLEEEGGPVLRITLGIPPGGQVYGHSLKVDLPEGGKAVPLPDRGTKPGIDHGEPVFDRDSVLYYGLRQAKPPLRVDFEYQGCTGSACLLPTVRSFLLAGTERPDGEPIPAATAAADPSGAFGGGGDPLFAKTLRFREVGRLSGYRGGRDFLAWLRGGLGGGTPPEGDLLQRVSARHGLLLAALLVIPLGLLLNLTPCVLPMIPINLSVIGAGARSGSGKGRGGLLGALYGGAMAVVYGGMGAVVVKTGSRFGAVNSSAWFNWTVAAVFLLLALAMFDVFILDLSRFRRGGRRTGSPYVTAVVLGGVSALLAGACVAPVLIWVLLLAADLQARGNAAGMFLPLLLGIGLGLPWPFLGAGISRLPRPGRWMVHLKKAMGLLILLFALHYAWLGFRIAGKSEAGMEGWENDLAPALDRALAEQRPVILDFWGVACRSCAAMARTTLRNPRVRAELQGLVRVQIQADDLHDPQVANVLRRFRIAGLPTFILLKPAPAPTGPAPAAMSSPADKRP